MPASTPPIRRLTRAEYHTIGETGLFEGDRVELIHGIVVHKPVISGEHAYSVDQLNELLGDALRGKARIRVQQPVAASEDSEPEPDIAVVPRGAYIDDHPREAWLVVEVAKHSLAHDRGEKAALYAAMGVPQYWVVNLVEQVIEVFEQPGPEGYEHTTMARPGDRLALTAFPHVTLAVDDVLPPPGR